MKVLVIGSGGREHALCWAIAASPVLENLWCAPGNPGIAEFAECIPIDIMDFPALIQFASEHKVDLVIPGPEAPLVAGITDAMQAAGIACFGPTKAAARLEGSKAFAKEIADAAGIPTASWRQFEKAEEAKKYIRRHGTPIVVKADGLAAGKGVIIANNDDEAFSAIDAIMEKRAFGDSGSTVVIEECLVGEEVSLFALCDGLSAVLLGSAQDHKRVGDGDTGPNTGGMGAYAPVPTFPPSDENKAFNLMIRPALAEMARRGTPFRGVLFAGLMLTPSGPKLIEFNVRFGDPECQVLLSRLQSDLLPALRAACNGELSKVDLGFQQKATVGVVMAAKGYPEAPQLGGIISGLDRANTMPGVRVFHAGTKGDTDGTIRAASGRVLAVCATADTLKEARDQAYRAIDQINWPSGFCRRDIGWRALK
jgi:phosphoribosylamine--glycine ligase